MAPIIGLSPIMGTQVSAMWQPPVQQERNIEDCPKDELIAMLPYLWKRFWDGMDYVHEDKKYEDILFEYISPRVGENAYDAGCSNLIHDNEEWKANFANSWKINGEAYELVKDYDRQYFENLVKELINQINVIKILMDQEFYDLELATL